LSEGCYFLRTNITDWSAEDLWQAYIQLTEAEAAFRIEKSDLRIRPIWHQNEERVYPRGASKWNPIEHRLFGPITKNWAGHPLRSMETLLGFLRGTTTKTGLKVNARWNPKKYPPKEKVSKEEKTRLNLKKHNVITFAYLLA